MEEIYEEKNKKTKSNNKILIIVIIILSVLLLGTISYIVYDKVFAKAEVKEETKKEPEKVEQEEDRITLVTESQVTTMMEQIKAYNEKLSTSYPIQNINEIDSLKIIDMTYTRIPNIKYVENYSFMQTDLENVVTKYFGNEFKLVHQNIPCFCTNKIMFKYDSAKRNYTFYGMHGHGGSSINEGYAYFLDGTYNETQKIYTINTKVLYRNAIHGISGPATNYYKSGNDAMKGTNSIYTVPDEEVMTLQPVSVYEKVKEQLPITTYEFKVDSEGNYGLTKVTIK